MQITEVRIKLTDNSEDRLRGFCSITFDHCFVVRDLKIIDGPSGPFVAMPSRKIAAHCPKCRSKNHLRARFCNHCGIKLPQAPIPIDHSGRPRLYADIAHPVNAKCREMIQNRIIEEFEMELQRSREPGYQSRYEDDFDADDWVARQDTVHGGEQETRVDHPQKKGASRQRRHPGESTQKPPHTNVASPQESRQDSSEQ